MNATERTVIIVAPADDAHACTVAWEIRRMGALVHILDSADFPVSWGIQMHAASEGAAQYAVVTPEGKRINDRDIAGVWLRRTKDHVVPKGVRDARHRGFCQSESRALFEGWIYSLGRRVINPLEKELAARRKPYQLAMAARSNLKIPETLCTNDPAAVQEMISAGGNHIYKILTNTSWQLTETRPLGELETNQLPLLRVAPVIFQQRIDGPLDIRATIVDDEVFTVELKANHPEAWLDWRLDLAVEIRPHTLPSVVAKGLCDFQRALGLRYGALDLRIDDSGKYVFFEVNPGGQYLFAEIHGRLPISASIARALLSCGPEERVQPVTHAAGVALR